jgi:hypothetical protein
MIPIQLWLPLVHGGGHDQERLRDWSRGCADWDRDGVVWFMPGWSGPDTWRQDGARVRCIASETMECVRVLHIDEKLRVCGPAAGEFPEFSAEGLLDRWLLNQFPALEITEQPLAFDTWVPHSIPAGITYRKASIPARPGAVLPVHSLDDAQRKVILAWPDDKKAPRPVSPEQEALGLPNASGANVGCNIVWPRPFEDMMPKLSSPDDLFAQTRMREIGRVSSEDPGKALKQALTWATPWLRRGVSNLNLAWLSPIRWTEGEEGALAALYTRFDIEAGSLREVYSDERYHEILSSPVEVRQVWGVPGLMWALLIERLQTGKPLRFCERCGEVLQGRSHARFCSSRANPECRRAYEKERKRRQRVGEAGVVGNG